MQQLIENLIANKENYHPMSYGRFMTELTNGLATEKQQHIETFNAGTKARYMKAAKEMGLETLPERVETGEQYYNQTYGQ